jgi:hypothetical protein
MKMGKEQVRRRRFSGINGSARKKKSNTPMGKCPGKARRGIKNHSYRAKFAFVASTLCQGVFSPSEKQPPSSCYQLSVEEGECGVVSLSTSRLELSVSFQEGSIKAQKEEGARGADPKTR